MKIERKQDCAFIYSLFLTVEMMLLVLYHMDCNWKTNKTFSSKRIKHREIKKYHFTAKYETQILYKIKKQNAVFPMCTHTKIMFIVKF